MEIHADMNNNINANLDVLKIFSEIHLCVKNKLRQSKIRMREKTFFEKQLNTIAYWLLIGMLNLLILGIFSWLSVSTDNKWNMMVVSVISLVAMALIIALNFMGKWALTIGINIINFMFFSLLEVYLFSKLELIYKEDFIIKDIGSTIVLLLAGYIGYLIFIVIAAVHDKIQAYRDKIIAEDIEKAELKKKEEEKEREEKLLKFEKTLRH